MRLFALSAAARGINVNVVIPGVTETDAWRRLAQTRGAEPDSMIQSFAESVVPMKRTITT